MARVATGATRRQEATLNGKRTLDAHVPRPLAVAAAYGWRVLVVAGAAYVLAWCLTQLFVILVPLVLALFIASALHPFVDRLRRWGWPSALATTAVFALLVIVLTLLALWLSGRVRGQFDDLGQQVRQGIDQVEQWLVDGPLNLKPQRVRQLESEVTSVSSTGGGLTQRLLGRARQLIEVLAGIVLTFFAAFFLLKDGERIGAWMRERIPPPYRDDASVIATRSRITMRWYLLGTAGVGLADALMLAVVLILLGVPLVLPLSVLTFAGAFFPLVGAFTAGAIATLVALVSGGFQTALLVVLATIAVQQIEGNILQPVILGRAVQLHPLVTLFAVSGGLIVAGRVGAFLAVPLVAQVTGYYYEPDAAST